MTNLLGVFRRLAAIALSSTVIAGAVGLAPAMAVPQRPAGAVHAQTSGFNFGIEPYNEPGTAKRSAFDLDGPVGATINDRVEVVNSGPTAEQFYIYPAGAYTIENGGGFAVNLRSDPRSDIASWITLPVQMYTVPPHTGSVIPVRLSIPSNATPGDHTAAIVAEQIIAPGQVKTGEGVTVVHRVGARVYLRVIGPVHLGLHVDPVRLKHKLPLNPLAAGHTQTLVDFVVKNTGNARLALATITITTKGIFGQTLHKVVLTGQKPGGPNIPTEILPAQILPGGQVRLLAPFRGLPPIDQVTMSIVVNGADAVAGTRASTSASTSFWVIPWLALLVLVVLIAGYLLFRRWYLRGRRRRAEPPPADKPGPTSKAQTSMPEPARL